MVELLEIKHFICDKTIKSNRGQVADGNFIRVRVFDDLCAKVGALDCPQVLLIGLPIASIFIEHIRKSCFTLTGYNDSPQIASFDLSSIALLCLIPESRTMKVLSASNRASQLQINLLLVKLFKFFSPCVYQSWTLVRTHQRPILVGLDTLHKQIRDPEG